MDALLLSNVSVFWLTCHNNLWHHSLTDYHCFTWNVRAFLQSHIGIVFQNKSVGEMSISIDVSAYVCVRRQTHRSKISACESLEIQSYRTKQHKMGYFSWAAHRFSALWKTPCMLWPQMMQHKWYHIAEKWTACLNGQHLENEQHQFQIDSFIYFVLFPWFIFLLINQAKEHNIKS